MGNPEIASPTHGIKNVYHASRVLESTATSIASSLSENPTTKNKIPSKEDIIKIWREFRSIPQELNLPFAPKQPIIYLDNLDRPQPKKDRDNDKGMAGTIGRLRKDTILDYKFVALSHNTVRGAAGGAILNAELLKAKGFIKII